MHSSTISIHFIRISIVFISVFTLSNASAQLKLTPTIGLSISKVQNTGIIEECTYYAYDEQFHPPQFNYGLDVGKQLSKSFEINIGINYNSGLVMAKRPYWSCHDDAGFISLSYQYLYIRPRLKYTINSTFFLTAGVYGGFNIGIHSSDDSFAGPTVYNLKDSVKRENKGLHAGLGYQFNRYQIHFEYLHGYGEIIGEDQLSWIQMSLGYVFEVNKRKR